MKKIILAGYTNKEKYQIDNTFVLMKEKNGFNHGIDYSQLKEFDFVPKLIEDSDGKIIWEFIDGEMLSNPTNDDLKEIGRILRIIHKSEITVPKNNFKQRINSYLKKYYDKPERIKEIDDHYKEMIRLVSRMKKINVCHNDLWSENILKDKNGKIWLVDWEYSTMGDKHFDLSFFIKSLKLNNDQEDIFLKSYGAQEENVYNPKLMLGYKRFTAWLTLVWAYSQPSIPFDLTYIKKYINDTNFKK